jgi:hypothetical protein
MFDYLLKFNKLPQELRDEVSTPLVMASIDELEERFGVNLATVIMRVMVKEISFADLKQFFMEEFQLSEPMSEQLQVELAGRVFLKVADYLGIDLEAIVSKTGADAAPPGPDIMAVPAAPAAAENQVRGAQFFFSSEDEEEIRELTKKSIAEPQAQERVNNAADLEGRLAIIITKAEINFGSEELTSRFKLILRTYLRGIRTRLDTKLTLTKAFESGGLGFDSDSAEMVLGLADKSEELLKSEPKKEAVATKPPANSLDALMAVGARDIEYDLGKELAKKEAAKAVISPAPPAAEPAQVPPIATEIEPQPEVPIQAFSKIPAVPQPEPEMEPLVIKHAPETGSKIKMADIKYVPKTMEPSEELGFMDLASFRRLEKEPEKIIGKIRDKIKLLEAESYGKKLEAVKAWRQSPVNKLYLAIGEAAIANNKPIDIIIEERRAGGEEVLSSEEFEAIMTLNKDLRY